jgi:hypothetical protein
MAFFAVARWIHVSCFDAATLVTFIDAPSRTCRYEGLTKEGVCHANGVMHYANGDRYRTSTRNTKSPTSWMTFVAKCSIYGAGMKASLCKGSRMATGCMCGRMACTPPS